MGIAIHKLGLIKGTGILSLDLGWLNSNYQRALFHKVRSLPHHRLREVKAPVRYRALAHTVNRNPPEGR